MTWATDGYSANYVEYAFQAPFPSIVSLSFTVRIPREIGDEALIANIESAVESALVNLAEGLEPYVEGQPSTLVHRVTYGCVEEEVISGNPPVS